MSINLFQTIFVPQLLEVPEIKSEFSGREGFNKHFAEMLGDEEMEGKSRRKNIL